MDAVDILRDVPARFGISRLAYAVVVRKVPNGVVHGVADMNTSAARVIEHTHGDVLGLMTL